MLVVVAAAVVVEPQDLPLLLAVDGQQRVDHLGQDAVAGGGDRPVEGHVGVVQGGVVAEVEAARCLPQQAGEPLQVAGAADGGGAAGQLRLDQQPRVQEL